MTTKLVRDLKAGDVIAATDGLGDVKVLTDATVGANGRATFSGEDAKGRVATNAIVGTWEVEVR
jgi:hypothetical protein